MINHISIKNFATIESLSVDFHSGLNIITGETGAGKSIIIEAVNLALGSRADTTLIRSGEEKAIVQLVADYNGEEIIITRELSAAGKSRCKIDDEIVTQSHLKEICTRIADIHGQYDHQSLLIPEHHIDLVDNYGKEKIAGQKEKVASIYADYSKVSTKLSSLLSSFAEKQRKLDFMKFELQEITDADLAENEDETLKEKISILENSEKIYANLQNAYGAASNDEISAQQILSAIMNLTSEISSYSTELGELSEEVTDIYYRFEDVISRIRDCADSITYSPEELNSAIERLDLVERMKSKYGGSIDSVLQHARTLESELSEVENIDDLKEKLTAQKDALREQLTRESEELTSLRKTYAAELTTKIQSELKELNFNNSQLEMTFEEREFSPSGTDYAEFLISTNRGTPLRPLAKIASGGEMSRIMLAFKKIIGDYDEIPTMIFDEIDAGISGIAASVVGRKLKSIAGKHQIICITHLPQIAACGTHNYKIQKDTIDGNTFTTIVPMTKDEKKMEIARLLGGDNITDTTLASAGELITISE